MEQAREEVAELHVIPSGVLSLTADGGRSLELMTWRGEPAVLVDGKYLLRHSMIVRQIMRSPSAATRKGVDNGCD